MRHDDVVDCLHMRSMPTLAGNRFAHQLHNERAFIPAAEDFFELVL